MLHVLPNRRRGFGGVVNFVFIIKHIFPCSYGNKHMRLLTRVYGITYTNTRVTGNYVVSALFPYCTRIHVITNLSKVSELNGFSLVSLVMEPMTAENKRYFAQA